MTPPTFHIGDNVEVIGPSITGNDIHLGKRFKIECMYVNPSQHIQFEPYDGTYYPASSLQLAPQFTIGNLVEVVRASNYDSRHLVGEKFTIDDIEGDRYTAVGYPWIRADCLRLVEELKIGDLVKVIGHPKGILRDIDIGRIGQIDKIGANAGRQVFGYYYDSSALRKLTPEEIKQHTNPGKQYPITPAKDFDELTLRDVARMAGICKNEYGVWISTLLKRAHETEDRLSAIEKRLDFVEQIQRTEYKRNGLWAAGP